MLKPAAPPPSIDNPAEAGLRQASGGGDGWAPRPRIDDDAAEAVVNQAAGGGGGKVAGASAELGGWSKQEGAGRGGGAIVRTPPVRQSNEMSAERRGRQAGMKESRGIIDSKRLTLNRVRAALTCCGRGAVDAGAGSCDGIHDDRKRDARTDSRDAGFRQGGGGLRWLGVALAVDRNPFAAGFFCLQPCENRCIAVVHGLKCDFEAVALWVSFGKTFINESSQSFLQCMRITAFFETYGTLKMNFIN